MNTKIKNTSVCGIDLGTGYTEIAIMDETGKPTVVANLDGEFKTPSVVYFGPKQEIVVGTPALNMGVVHPERTVKEAKRDVGTPKEYFMVDGESVTPELVQGKILIFTRKSVITYANDPGAAKDAVITVPAYFKENQRQSVIKSAQLAGINVLALINEPTAAALAHGLNVKQGDRLVLIVDLGSGTLDCSLVAYAAGEANVIASHGDNQLGGKDVDEILLELIREQFRQEHQLEFTPQTHPADYFQAWQNVVRLKERLSSCSSSKLCIRVDGKQLMREISRDELSQHLAPLMARAEKVIETTIANAKVRLDEITDILPIGGSSRLTVFQELLKQIFGAERITGGKVSPDFAVVEGATIHAANLVASKGATLVDQALKAIPKPRIKQTDAMPHSLGILVQDPVSLQQTCSVVLEKNQPLPCSAMKSFGAVTNDQTRFAVSVVQAEEGQVLEDCLVVGKDELAFPARPVGQPSIEVTMSYDTSAMAKVIVKDLVSGKEENITANFYKK